MYRVIKSSTAINAKSALEPTIPLYIRFGEIPEDLMSKAYSGDQVVREEGGLSVWRACEADGQYWPLLPEEPNKNAIADYFSFLIFSDRPVYLVTGDEMFIEGADREPLLMNPKIIKDITWQFCEESYESSSGGTLSSSEVVEETEDDEEDFE